MLRRTSAICLRFVAWLIASVAVIAAIVLWRLASGPVSLEPVTPYIENALSPGTGVLRVEVGETRIQLRDAGLELVVVDVRGVRPDGEPVFDLPEVELDLSVRALLTQGLIAPVRLDARAPRLVLVRRTDGTVALAGDRGGDRAADIDVREVVALLGRDDRGEPLAWLEELRFAGGRLILEDEVTDRRLQAEHAELAVARRTGGLAARLDFVVSESAAETRVSARADLDAGSERIAFEVDVGALDPALLRQVVPSLPAELDGLDLAFGGRFAGAVTSEGALAPVRFDLASNGGVARLPDRLAGDLPVDTMTAEGSIDPEAASLTVDFLSVETGDTTLRGSGRIGWGEPGMSVAADLEARRVAVEDLELLWPPAVADNARAWVLENMSDAVAPRGEVHIDIRPGDLDREPLREDAVRGSYGIEGATVRYFRHLPPLSEVDARATFTAQTMEFEVTGGRYRDLEVEQGEVRITGLGIEGDHATQLEVDTTIAGPLPTALELIDLPPFGFAADLGIAPAATTGSSRTELHVGLPLYDGVRNEEVRLAAEATLREVTADGLMGGIDLREGGFALTVDREGMALDGEAVVRGVPVNVEWREAFADDADFDRRYRLSGFLDREHFEGLGLDALPVESSGGFDFDVSGVERGSVQEIDATLDLAALGLEVPELDWRKRAEEPGELRLSATIPEDGAVSVDSFTFAGAALEAAGSLALARDTLALQALRLDRFSHRRQQGSLDLVREGDGLRIDVSAASLELDPLLGDEVDLFAGQDAPRPLRASVRAEELFYRGETLTDVRAQAERARDGWRSARIEGRLPNGAPFDLGLEPGPEAGILTVTSSDAGEVWRVLDEQRIEGGHLSLEATIAEQVPDLDAEGNLRIDDFVLLDAPVLARLLTLASLTGIGNLLGGEGIFVDRLDVPFAVTDGVLTVNEGRLSGSQLGLTLDGTAGIDDGDLDLRGTIVPVYTINRVIGGIPILGDFLAGSEGEGAFAFTFRMRGNADDPEITVNPLSVLAPGFLRELFGGLTRGDLEPPPPPADD